MNLTHFTNRLRITYKVIISYFVSGVTVNKDGNVAVFLNGGLAREDCMHVAEHLIEMADEIIETEYSNLVDNGQAKKASKLKIQYANLKSG